MSLHAQDLRYSASGRELLRGVSLNVAPGQLHAVLGPNGAGKSTLLRLLARETAPAQGHITLNNKLLTDWDAQALARQRAVLPQSESLRFAFNVQQVVELGRLPCAQHGPEQEQRIIQEALALTNALHLKDRLYPTLSGGERQRVQFARVLAQIWEAVDEAPRYLLLDEPTASLDLKHQHDCLRVARQFAVRGVGVCAILHDPNLALTYADQVTLVCDGAAVASGTPGEVLNRENLQRVYGVTVEIVTLAGRPHIAVI